MSTSTEQVAQILALLRRVAPIIRRSTYDTHPGDEMYQLDADICRALNQAEGAAAPAADTEHPRVCCEECGCEDIEYLAYVHANDERIVSLDESSAGYFCPECEEHECGAVEVGGPNDPRKHPKPAQADDDEAAS